MTMPDIAVRKAIRPEGDRPAAFTAGSIKMLTLRQVADVTALSLAHLRREIRLKRLTVYRFGRTIRVVEGDLQAYLDARRKPHR